MWVTLPLVPVEQLPERLRDRERLGVGALALALGDAVKERVCVTEREADGREALREGRVGLGEALVGVNVRVPGDSVQVTVCRESDREPVVRLGVGVNDRLGLPVEWPDPVTLYESERETVRVKEDTVSVGVRVPRELDREGLWVAERVTVRLRLGDPEDEGDGEQGEPLGLVLRVPDPDGRDTERESERVRVRDQEAVRVVEPELEQELLWDRLTVGEPDPVGAVGDNEAGAVGDADEVRLRERLRLRDWERVALGL